MTLEMIPSVVCNLSCTYCYQNPMRDAGNQGGKYSVGAMLAQADQKFTLFGGEALLMPMKDLETFFAFGLAKYGENNIQTNGVLITPAHITLFKKYKVSVGISVDGPETLNAARCGEEETRKTLENVQNLCKAGIIPGIITTLSTVNAIPERIPTMIRWFQEMDKLGIPQVRLHLLEEDEERASYLRLSEQDLISALGILYQLELRKLTFDLFEEVKKRWSDLNAGSCVFSGCDPYTTPAVQGVDGDGTRSNCGRTNKDGVAYRKSAHAGSERQLALLHTSFEFGGCKDCRYWSICQGYCPGTAIEGDWRNRTEHCSVLFEVYKWIEASMGRTPPAPVQASSSQVNVPHGDVPHGDSWSLVGTKDAPIRF